MTPSGPDKLRIAGGGDEFLDVIDDGRDNNDADCLD